MILKKLKNNKIFSNASWIIGCKLGKAFLVLLSTMIMSRYLGVSNYGVISYVASLVTFVIPIMQLGLPDILVHEIILFPENEGKIIGTSIVLNLLSGLLCLFGISVFVKIVNRGEYEVFIVCLCYGLLIIFRALETIYYWFQAKLMSKYTSIAILIAYIIVTVIQCLCAFFKVSIFLVAITYSIEYLIIAIILLYFYRIKNGQKFVFSISWAKKLLNKGKYYIISGLMVMIFSQTDKIMLKFMTGDSAVGLYSAATVCASMSSFVFVAIIDSMRPTIFQAKENKVKFENQIMILYSIIILFSFMQSLEISGLAPLIINIIYGKLYKDAVSILQIVVWFTTFSYIGTIRNIWMLAKDCQRYLFPINALGAIVNICLNLLLIEKYGAKGAAIASVIAQFFTNVLVGYLFSPLRENNRLMIGALNLKRILNNIK